VCIQLLCQIISFTSNYELRTNNVIFATLEKFALMKLLLEDMVLKIELFPHDMVNRALWMQCNTILTRSVMVKVICYFISDFSSNYYAAFFATRIIILNIWMLLPGAEISLLTPINTLCN
jgi:hypothetical protein